ncbi:MAG: TRAP transporter small permease subunit [Gammaproteobacteria bacterium]|jgi:TRAP-type C4-dicarboxylate transport system permease small subunit|nr:TRAP transporter small permease subunit [Gammaproteobacteria bacterium]
MLMVVLRVLATVNNRILPIGRLVASIGLAVMVVVILLQVFFRYVLNDAMAWPDEFARFLMLWMTCLMAPSAFRWGGFVAIDMFLRHLPQLLGRVAALVLLLMSATVLWVGIKHGYNHTLGFGGNFTSSSLRLPLDWIGFEMVRVKLRYMYASLLLGTGLMLLVNVELILRLIMQLWNADAVLPTTDQPTTYSVEAE